MFLYSISDPSMGYMSDWLNIMRRFNFSQSKLAELVREAMVVIILHYITVDFSYVIIKFCLRRRRWIWRPCLKNSSYTVKGDAIQLLLDFLQMPETIQRSLVTPLHSRCSAELCLIPSNNICSRQYIFYSIPSTVAIGWAKILRNIYSSNFKQLVALRIYDSKAVLSPLTVISG